MMNLPQIARPRLCKADSIRMRTVKRKHAIRGNRVGVGIVGSVGASLVSLGIWQRSCITYLHAWAQVQGFYGTGRQRLKKGFAATATALSAFSIVNQDLRLLCYVVQHIQMPKLMLL